MNAANGLCSGKSVAAFSARSEGEGIFVNVQLAVTLPEWA